MEECILHPFVRFLISIGIISLFSLFVFFLYKVTELYEDVQELKKNK